MKILALETSAKSVSCAVGGDGAPLAPLGSPADEVDQIDLV